MSRGRGRGRGQSLSFNIEAIGFNRGDLLPTAVVHPPPKYPPLKKRPTPLRSGEDQDYLLALEKEFEKTVKNSPFWIREEQKKSDVERYSDKYQINTLSDNILEFEPDWGRFPLELKINKRRKKITGKRIKPNTSKISSQNFIKDVGDVVKNLEELEKTVETENEKKAPDEKNKEETKESGTESEIGEFEDEEEEEENDYLTSYFDNGESYLDEEEDNIDDKDGGIY